MQLMRIIPPPLKAYVGRPRGWTTVRRFHMNHALIGGISRQLSNYQTQPQTVQHTLTCRLRQAQRAIHQQTYTLNAPLTQPSQLKLHTRSNHIDEDEEEDDDDTPVRTLSPSGFVKKPKKNTLRIVYAQSAGWEVVIGIEVHAQIRADSKLFSGASTQFGGTTNSHTSYVDAAMPGTLPVLNAFSVAQAIRTGLGLGGEIQTVSKFERKHYFYADMPQGYQITQQQFPIVRGGQIVLDEGDEKKKIKPRTVRITRIQLEQDSGKSLHDLHPTRSYVDLNRAGVGLMEIVSEADIRSSSDAALYIRKLSSLLQSIGTCRAHMEDGSLRADVNVSIRRPGADYGERVEVKNLNSLRSLQRAIEYEVDRQIKSIGAKIPVARETRTFDAKTGATILLRSKENMLDYRFAPEPDLPPLILPSQLLHDVTSTMPELPAAMTHRFRTVYGLSAYDTGVLLSEEGAAHFMDQLVYGPDGYRRTPLSSPSPDQKAQVMLRNPKRCANWLMNELFGRLKKMKAMNGTVMDETDESDEVDDETIVAFAGAAGRATLSISPVTSATLGSLIDLVESGLISGKVGKDVLDLLMNPDETRTPKQIVEENQWTQKEPDSEVLAVLCSRVISQYPTEVSSILSGNKRRFGFLTGQVLKLGAESPEIGQLNPGAVAKKMTELIEQQRNK